MSMKETEFYLPEKTSVDTFLACEEGRGPIFAVTTRVTRDEGVINREYPVLYRDMSPDNVAAMHARRDGAVVGVQVVRACRGTTHADVTATRDMLRRDGVYLNEVIGSYAIADEVEEPRTITNAHIVDLDLGRTVKVAEPTDVVIAARGAWPVYVAVHEHTQVVTPNSLPGWED